MDVLVTRPIEAGRRTADRLNALGHRAILAPLLTVRPLSARAPGGSFDAVAVTSQSVTVLADRLKPFFDIPTFAVGQRTADALTQAGFQAVIGSEGDVADLVSVMLVALPKHARVLYICGRERKGDLEAALTLGGHHVVTWIGYAAEPAIDLAPGVTHRLGTGQIDAVLHYSERTARIFATLCRRLRLIGGMSLTPQICLAPDVARPLREAGITRIAIAETPDEAALFDELRRFAD